MTCHSRCCSCFELDFVTEEVWIPGDLSEVSVEVEDC